MTNDDMTPFYNAVTQALLDQDKASLYDILQQFTHSDHISLFIHNKNNGSLYGLYSDFALDTRELTSNSLLGSAFLSKVAHRYDHIRSEKYYNNEIDNSYGSSLKSQVLLPIVDDNMLIGILRLSKTIANSRNFDKNILDYFSRIAPLMKQIVFAFQPKLYPKILTDTFKMDKKTQEVIVNELETIKSILNNISQNIECEIIRGLVEEGRRNADKIHQEYINRVLHERVAKQNENDEQKKKLHFLVADDVRLNVSILEAILKDQEHNIYTANDGDIALEKIEKLHSMGETIDVLFLDHHMPNMLGSQVVDALLKESEKYSNKKIFIVSITNDTLAFEETKKLYDYHIRKPFIKSQILEILHHIKEAMQS